MCPLQTMGRLRTARLVLGVLSLASALGVVYRAFLLNGSVERNGALPAAKYVFQPKRCKLSTKLLVCVFSRPINVEHRLAIRDTWGRAFTNAGAEVVFLLGSSPAAQLDDERHLYGDIVQEDFRDTYYNLTLKSLAMIRYAAVYCPAVGHVLKLDDDVLINTKKFLDEVRQLSWPKSIWGNLAQAWTPIRQPSSKWYVPMHLYNGTRFPDFVTGVGYLMSGDCPTLLYQGSLHSRYFYLEDVFWTGLIAEKMGIARYAHGGFANSRVFLRACDTSQGPWFMSHGYTPEYLRISWKSLQKRLEMCSKLFRTKSSENYNNNNNINVNNINNNSSSNNNTSGRVSPAHR